ncbi:hypothetical protein H9P43_005256 [Blastocladiella emersonii ATCC 22665]|nr:hypothetical protein H9P43_005256 [Blastocladiella emersonii ATCC 22665]
MYHPSANETHYDLDARQPRGDRQQPPARVRHQGLDILKTHGPETIEPASLATRRQARSSGSAAATACVKSQSQPLVIHWSLAAPSNRHLSTDEQLARSIRKLYGAVFEATRSDL